MKTKIESIQEHFPMIVLLKKLQILPLNFNINYRFPCPIHQGDNPTCCHFTPNNKFHCWKCGKDFDIVDVYMHIRNLSSFSTAIKRIEKFMQTDEFKTLIQQEETNTTQLTSNPFKQPYRPQVKTPADDQAIIATKRQLIQTVTPLFNKIRDYYHHLLITNNSESQVGMKYLTQTRKLTLETIKEFKLGYAPLTDKPLSFRFLNFCQQQNFNLEELLKFGFIKTKTNTQGKTYHYDTFHGSVIIPIESGNHRTLHFYQNHFRPTKYFQPKYQALINFSQTPTFYFSYRFFEALPYIRQTKTIIIHEGFFDVISCWQNNIKNTVGLICVTQLLSQPQLDILKKENIKTIVILDNDETGRKRSEAIGEQLKNENIQYEIRHILPPYDKTCKDVDDLLRQYGMAAYQKCFLDPYCTPQEAQINIKKQLIKDLFGNDIKITIKKSNNLLLK